MKNVLSKLLIILFIFFFISSIFAFQIERYDTHIQDESIRLNMLILKSLMAFSSFFSALFLFLKKEKLAFIFILLFLTIILYNTSKNI